MRLEKADIRNLAIVDRPCSRHNFIVKADGSVAVTFFFPFEIAKSEEGTISGLAYSRPDEPDGVGDYATAEDLRHMAETFRKNGHTMNLMHQRDLRADEAHVVQSEILRDGSWRVVAKIDDPDILRDCRDGVYRGFSVGGTCMAKREQTAEEERAELLQLLAATRRMAEMEGVDLAEVDAQRERDEARRAACDLVWNSQLSNRDWVFPELRR
jgi:hypothetical protein